MGANRVSDESNNNNSISTPCIPLDEENPYKKIKLCVEDNIDEDNGYLDKALPNGDFFRVPDDCGVISIHYRSFIFDNKPYYLEDTVLVTPEEGKVKPSIAIIKHIFLDEKRGVRVCGRRFFRPDEAEKKEGGTWETHDVRELFYSSYLDELDACNVMHKCTMHMVPLGNTLPDRKEQPGFIVQKFYDIETKDIRDLTVRDCEEPKLSQPGASETA